MKKILVTISIIIIIIVFIILEIINLNSDKNIIIDIQKLGEELSNSEIFEDSISLVNKESIIKKYDLDTEKIKNVIAYEGSGATAEEILLIELFNKDDKNTIKEKIEAKIEERKQDFENYLPKEVFKLENYNLESKGSYIILCISNDCNKAKEIIEENIK